MCTNTFLLVRPSSCSFNLAHLTKRVRGIHNFTHHQNPRVTRESDWYLQLHRTIIIQKVKSDSRGWEVSIILDLILVVEDLKQKQSEHFPSEKVKRREVSNTLISCWVFLGDFPPKVLIATSKLQYLVLNLSPTQPIGELGNML